MQKIALPPEALREVSIFQGLSDQDRADLLPYLSARRYDESEMICNEGEISSELFIITSGFVQVLRIHQGQEVFVTHVSEGSYFGEAALFKNQERIASVRAQTEAVVLSLSQQGFEKFVQKHPKAGNLILMQMLREIFDRLSKMLQEFEEFQAEGMSQGEIDKFFS